MPLHGKDRSGKLSSKTQMPMKQTGLKYKFLISGIALVVIVVLTGLLLYNQLADQYPQQRQLLLVLLAMFFMASGITAVIVFAHIMIKPVVELTEKVDRIRQGQLDLDIHVASEGQFIDEMDLLYRGFAHMVASLKENFHQLSRAKDQAEKFSHELEKSKSRLEAIFNGISDGVMIIDRDYKVVAHNRKMKSILGFSGDRLIGEKCYQMCTGTEDKCGFCNARRVFETGQPIFTYCTKDDRESCEEKVFEVHNFPLRNKDGEVTQIVEYVKDVTDATRMRSNLEHARRLADIGTMAGKVAHEVRNPLNAIQGAAHYLKGELDNEEARNYINLIQEQVERVNGVTTQLLSLSKPMLPVLQPGNIMAAVERALQVTRPQLMALKANVVYKPPKTIPNLLINEGQLEQAIINIILNAVEAMDETDRPELRITYQIKEDVTTPHVEIIVEDNGVGLKENSYDDILKPFFTTKAKGTGLGLAIVKRIVDNHHGSFTLKSRPGEKGARAVIRLPIGGGAA